jgi:hypothetical protein
VSALGRAAHPGAAMESIRLRLNGVPSVRLPVADGWLHMEYERIRLPPSPSRRNPYMLPPCQNPMTCSAPPILWRPLNPTPTAHSRTG